MRKLVFFKKEIFEILKTPKIIVLPVVSLFFGILSPLTAKFTNELIKSMGGININLPDPVYTDSYLQLFKNHYTTTVIVMIFVFMGLIADEKRRGSALLVLTKNLSRMNFVLSKFFASALLFTFSYVISVIACVYYTYFLFGWYWNDGLLISLLMFWVFGMFMIALMTFASIVSKSSKIAALYGFIGFVAASIIAALPKIGNYSPGIMNGLSLEIMKGTKPATDSLYPIITCIVLALIFLVLGIRIFKKQEL